MSATTTLESVNPATGEAFDSFAVHTEAEVTARIVAADARHRDWRRTSFEHRSEILRAAGDVLERDAKTLAVRMADEMGKPETQGRAEAEKSAWACRYYADHAEEFLADRDIETDNSHSFVHHEPLGVVLAVMPWNFPLWQVFRFLAPALMAGNGTLLKHASNVSGTALDIERIMTEAGAPDGLFSTLLLPSDRVEAVLDHDLVRAVTLTGSGPAGRAVASQAGHRLKKQVLELGGSDPYVVLADADIEHAADVCADARLTNSGQSCIAGKRFVVVDEVHDDFVEAFVAAMSSRTVGDPHDDGTDIGPQAKVSLRDELHDQVRATIDAGAAAVLGGTLPDRDGAWYDPTVVVDVTPDMTMGGEETFGPAAAVLRARDEAHAIEIANDTVYGLGAAVFTADIENGRRIAATELRAGFCAVNTKVASDPRLPFGGIGRSGYGRELSDLGIREFVNQKTVVVA